MKFVCAVLILLLSASAVYGGWGYYKKKYGPQGWVTEQIDRGDIQQKVSATGSLAALETVDVGCQISGIVSSISVDFNSLVKAGQLIAVIDPSVYEAQVHQAKANLENADATVRIYSSQLDNLNAMLLSAQSDLRASESNVKKSELALEDASRNYGRVSELHSKKLVSISDLDSASTANQSQKVGLEGSKATVDSARTKIDSIRAQIQSARAQFDGAQAQVKLQQAMLEIAEINLSRTKIFSPINGIVISRAVDAGQTVAASLQAPKLFSIANDLRKMRIETAVDEADIGKVKEGQPVTFTVDAFKGRTFEGKVGQVRLAPVTSKNVVTYSTMVDVENNDLMLKPGMTANVEILVETRSNVLRVPTHAFYFRPSSTANIQETKNTDEGSGTLRLYVIGSNSSLLPVDVMTGILNNQFSELLGDSLKEGHEVVVAEKKAGMIYPTRGKKVEKEPGKESENHEGTNAHSPK
ncbi:MAG: efflux RND transporter periplasmic adaptor subunit [Candidatus Ozemobacteraceae bacterium]